MSLNSDPRELYEDAWIPEVLPRGLEQALNTFHSRAFVDRQKAPSFNDGIRTLARISWFCQEHAKPNNGSAAMKHCPSSRDCCGETMWTPARASVVLRPRLHSLINGWWISWRRTLYTPSRSETNSSWHPPVFRIMRARPRARHAVIRTVNVRN